MSSPQPLAGTNPYTGMYQKRQFGLGRVNLTSARVFDDLQSPPAAGVTAEAVNPLEEQADQAASPQPGIV